MAWFERKSKNLGRHPEVDARNVALMDVAQTAARTARAALFAPALSDPALLAESAMHVYVLSNAGNMKEAALIAGAVPRVARFWSGGQCHPGELLRLYRAWSEETVLLRTPEVQRRDLPEHDRRAAQQPEEAPCHRPEEEEEAPAGGRQLVQRGRRSPARL